jgi:CheY-specific phosphatase CheX
MTTETATLKTGQADALWTILWETCAEMLEACGVSASPFEVTPSVAFSERHIAAFIGFTGAVRGSLVIAASSGLFRATYPLGAESGRQAGTADLMDWAGELANQTLGRIKRRFCARGVDFDTSSPTAVNGRHIAGRSSTRQGVFELAFEAANEIVSIGFEIMVPSDGVIFQTPAEPIACSAEGDLVLF